jgi:hypothetical protein
MIQKWDISRTLCFNLFYKLSVQFELNYWVSRGDVKQT